MKIFITGASRGLGLEMAKAALFRGHCVAIGVRAVSSEIEELKERYKDTAFPVALDVTKEDSIVGAAGEILERFGVLDALVNNAAVLVGREDYIETVAIDDIRACMEVNVYGAIRVVQAMLPLIKQAGGGMIMNISSESGALYQTRLDDYPYCISKAALNMASEKMRKYLKKDQIRVITVHPGWMRTDMGGKEAPLPPKGTAELLLGMLEGKRAVEENCLMVDRFGVRMPMGVEKSE